MALQSFSNLVANHLQPSSGAGALLARENSQIELQEISRKNPQKKPVALSGASRNRSPDTGFRPWGQGRTCFIHCLAFSSALPKRSNSARRQKVHISFISSRITPGSEMRHIMGKRSLTSRSASSGVAIVPSNCASSTVRSICLKLAPGTYPAAISSRPVSRGRGRMVSSGMAR